MPTIRHQVAGAERVVCQTRAQLELRKVRTSSGVPQRQTPSVLIVKHGRDQKFGPRVRHTQPGDAPVAEHVNRRAAGRWCPAQSIG